MKAENNYASAMAEKYAPQKGGEMLRLGQQGQSLTAFLKMLEFVQGGPLSTRIFQLLAEGTRSKLSRLSKKNLRDTVAAAETSVTQCFECVNAMAVPARCGRRVSLWSRLSRVKTGCCNLEIVLIFPTLAPYLLE
eukprot:4811273-Amphidinium_carterae.1